MVFEPEGSTCCHQMDPILRQSNTVHFPRSYVLVIILILSFCVNLGLQSDFSFTEFLPHSSPLVIRIFSSVYFHTPVVFAMYELKEQIYVKCSYRNSFERSKFKADI
jgi:hypothetical protein